jgi:hypothetical protein
MGMLEDRLKFHARRLAAASERLDAADAMPDGDEKIVAHDAAWGAVLAALDELDAIRLEAGR